MFNKKRDYNEDLRECDKFVHIEDATKWASNVFVFGALLGIILGISVSLVGYYMSMLTDFSVVP